MAKRTKTPTVNPTIAYLRSECYDILVATVHRTSRFYQQDCDAVWTGVLAKSEAELRETLNRQRAIARTTQREINCHCQF